MREEFDLKSFEMGTFQPTPVKTEVIQVAVSTNQLSQGYVSALLNHLRLDARGAKILEYLPDVKSEAHALRPLNAQNLEKYLMYLLEKRCEYVADKCTDFGKLRGLYIPSYWQFVISMIGEVRLRSRGLVIRPIAADSSGFSLEDAYAVSQQLGEFEQIINLHKAAFPRIKEGDEDVMTSALIADQVRSMSEAIHPAMTYVTAIANMKLAEETKFAMLYRIQYDDLSNFVIQSSFHRVL